jgi:hypothetical protein
VRSFDCRATLVLIPLLFALAGLVYLSVMAWKYPESEIVKDLTKTWYPRFKDALPFERFFGWTREEAQVNKLVQLRLLAPFFAALVVLGTGMILSNSLTYCLPR